MKKELGGKRLGNGSKMEVAMKNYERSTHDLSRVWRSSMACGVLVPFMSEIGLNGDTWKINLRSLVRTLPTTGPLFGSFKLQLDVFTCPIRLYQGLLHNNAVSIGLKMNQVKLPLINIKNNKNENGTINTTKSIHSSSLTNYLGVSAIKRNVEGMDLSALKFLAYYDIFKNYYANKQEKNFKMISGGETTTAFPSTISVYVEKQESTTQSNNPTDLTKRRGRSVTLINGTPTPSKEIATGVQPIVLERAIESMNTTNGQTLKDYSYPCTIEHITSDIQRITIYVLIDRVVKNRMDLISQYMTVRFKSSNTPVQLCTLMNTEMIEGYNPDIRTDLYPKDGLGVFRLTYKLTTPLSSTIKSGTASIETKAPSEWIFPVANGEPKIVDVPLENIDKGRREILKRCELGDLVKIDTTTTAAINFMPYITNARIDVTGKSENCYPMNGLVLKTYLSDLYNNWLDKELIDGVGGVSELSAVDITADKLSLDALNLKQKIYNMLNRIVASGNTYEDWQEAIYGEEAIRRAESPVYQGGASAEIVFEEVVSSSETETNASGNSPIGTLAGRGNLNGFHGGDITIDIKEPCIIMGIASITPRVDYRGGIKWDMQDLLTMDDLHKPELDGIGFQNLPANWMNGEVDPSLVVGKQPAFIEYMTAVNEVHGDFADDDSADFMVLTRRYDFDDNGQLSFTTYIDPAMFNHAFAVESLSAQNFWVQIGVDIEARRKMSAKLIPNL